MKSQAYSFQYYSGVEYTERQATMGSPNIIPGLPVTLLHSGILCHRGAGKEGSCRIILGLPVLLQHSSHQHSSHLHSGHMHSSHHILSAWDAVSLKHLIKLIFKVPATASRVLPGHILT